VAIDFRLAPVHPHPAALEDVNFAIRWLKAHAHEFGATPEGLGALGSSSGGHQVVLSALRPRDPRYASLPLPEAPEIDASVAYVVALWPVLDPLARYRYAREVGRADLVAASEAYFGSEAAMAEASPNLILARREEVDLPRVLVVWGTADANVPRAIVEGFVASYEAVGGEVDLAVYADAPHGFANRGGPDADAAIARIRRFLGDRPRRAVVP
jgi:acetyl esterase/lipase